MWLASELYAAEAGPIGVPGVWEAGRGKSYELKAQRQAAMGGHNALTLGRRPVAAHIDPEMVEAYVREAVSPVHRFQQR